MIFILVISVLSKKEKQTKGHSVEYIDDGLRSKISFNSSLLQEQRNSELHDYQAETSRLLSILTDNLYHNKDIFMREMISNANDALDKVRFQALSDSSVFKDGPKNLEILIDINEDEKTISITDTGIGMTKAELIENLGRIAKSGTQEFQKLLKSGDTNLIGQFGVGFYSSFLVSKSVTVISKSNNDTTQWIWSTDGISKFSIIEDPRGNTLGRGTSILLHLKDSCYNYLDRDRIMGIIRHYSMFVDFPVKIWHFKELLIEDEDEEEMDDDDIDATGLFDNEDVVIEEDHKSQLNKKKDHRDDFEDQSKTSFKTVWQWIQVNDNRPIWLRDPADISDSDYNEFFTMFFKEPKNPIKKIHFTAEGKLQFSALFFIPSVPPSSETLFAHVTRNVRLYVKRILLNDEWGDELLPDYLHFMKGVIDSNDLTLNVDRDRLVKSGSLKLINRHVTTKILSVFKNMFLTEPNKYDDFYSKYGANIKYGLVNDPANKRLLSKLLMFYTSYSPNKLTTLDDYIARMKKGQEKIYWIGTISIHEAQGSPFIEHLLSQGFEVIFALEPIDIHCFEGMEDFDGLPLENPEKFHEGESEKIQDVSGFDIKQRTFNGYFRWFKRIIGEKLEKITLSKRLKITPATCHATDYGYTGSHERLMRSQTVSDHEIEENLFMNKKILELNFNHPYIKDLLERIRKSPKDEKIHEETRFLFDVSLLNGGFHVSDFQNFTKRVFKMLAQTYDTYENVVAFEDENQVSYPSVENDLDSIDKNAYRISIKDHRSPPESVIKDEPDWVQQRTPEDWIKGILT